MGGGGMFSWYMNRGLMRMIRRRGYEIFLLRGRHRVVGGEGGDKRFGNK